MSLTWTIDAENRLFTVVAVGFVNRSEIEACLDAVESCGVLTYRKLFDGSEGDIMMSPEDLLMLGVRLREFHARGPMGALAFVLPIGRGERLMRVLGILATADRPMRIFVKLGSARRWLLKQRLPSPTATSGDA